MGHLSSVPAVKITWLDSSGVSVWREKDNFLSESSLRQRGPITWKMITCLDLLSYQPAVRQNQKWMFIFKTTGRATQLLEKEIGFQSLIQRLEEKRPSCPEAVRPSDLSFSQQTGTRHFNGWNKWEKAVSSPASLPSAAQSAPRRGSHAPSSPYKNFPRKRGATSPPGDHWACVLTLVFSRNSTLGQLLSFMETYQH